MRLKGLMAGIDPDLLPYTRIEDIEAGYEAERLRAWHQAQPALRMMADRISPLDLAEAEDKNKELEAKGKLAERLEKIRRGSEKKSVQVRENQFDFMPELLRARYVAQYGWPRVDEAARPYRGMSTTVARQLAALADDPKKPLKGWRALEAQFETEDDWLALYATAKIKPPGK